MFLLHFAEDAYIIMYGNYACSPFENIVHPHLENILSPKGILKNLYLPLWVLKVVRYDDGVSK